MRWRSAERTRPAYRRAWLAIALCTACDGSPPPIRTTLSLAEAMSGDTAGFERATQPRQFRFPEDYGPHPEFRTEWWYFTGNVDAANGRRFGFQLTFFRAAQTAALTERTSVWATRDVYLAHFAVTDIESGRFHHFERFARGAGGLAGAAGDPFRVWLEDWSVEAATQDEPDAPFPLRLRAAQDGIEVDFVVERGKPVVLQGDAGLSAKGPEPGNASFYYSFTRMPVTGRIRLRADAWDVDGLAWMDREWSTSALGEHIAGWDWFAIQLHDGRDLMIYQLRRHDGGADTHSAGMIVGVDGTATPLEADAFALEAVSSWSSAIDGTRYPARWRVRVPGESLDLFVEPAVADQEMNTVVRYWEGAVNVTGTAGGMPVRGRGYLEMTGY